MVESKADIAVEEVPPLVYIEAVSPETIGTAQFVCPRLQEEWTCRQCTLLNPARKLYCIACFHRHPDLTNVDVAHGQDYDDDDEDENHPFLSTDEIELKVEEDPFQKKIRRRMRRKHRMIAGGAAGVVVGAVVGSSAVVVAGMIGGAVGARVVSKHRELLKDKRIALERYMMDTKAKATP